MTFQCRIASCTGVVLPVKVSLLSSLPLKPLGIGPVGCGLRTRDKRKRKQKTPGKKSGRREARCPRFPVLVAKGQEGRGRLPSGDTERVGQLEAVPRHLPTALALSPSSTLGFLSSSSCGQRELDGGRDVLIPRLSFLSWGLSDHPAGAGSGCPRAHP